MFFVLDYNYQLIPLKSRRNVLKSLEIMDEETCVLIGRIRNGVETIPSIIRNKYLVNKMPSFRLTNLVYTHPFMANKLLCRTHSIKKFLL